MEKMNTRIFLLLSLVVVGLFLHSAWVQEHQKPNVSQPVSTGELSQSAPSELPTAPQELSSAETEGQTQRETPSLGEKRNIPSKRLIEVETDVYQLSIDRLGGDIVSLKLKAYPQSVETPEQGFELMANNDARYYVAESGLLSAVGPESPHAGKRATYLAPARNYLMRAGEDTLVVPLTYETPGGVKIEKRFVFNKDSYIINVEYGIQNDSDKTYKANFYGRLKRTQPTSKSGFMGAMRTYTGAGVYTPDKPYTKLPFDKMVDKPFKQTIEGGWAALIEHYFTSAWVPPAEEKNHFQSRKLSGDVFAVDVVGQSTVVPVGQSKTLSYQLYAGPEDTKVLKEIAKGLELTVDYGVLWFICQPIFWLLEHLFALLGNWGWAIIFTTLVIKLLFYKLSATAYRSMGNMRKLQPKIEEMKKRFGDDKQKFGQAMMELYRKEKVNPLGGCLPILLQIPVFIALYWVLLESVELRQAPFMLWITDLSVKDPFYVLPLLMGASMLLQQRLSPTPPDPVQAKVMMLMPIFFTVLFLQFPAGLMLYWVANNVLSIIQQWAITRGIEKSAKKA